LPFLEFIWPERLRWSDNLFALLVFSVHLLLQNVHKGLPADVAAVSLNFSDTFQRCFCDGTRPYGVPAAFFTLKPNFVFKKSA